MLSKKLRLGLALTVLFATVSMSSYTVMAANFDQQLGIDGQALYLNGEGPRKKAFITLYNTALYLTEKGSDGQAIIDADHPMSVSMVVESRFATASRISDAFREGLEKSTAGNTAAIEPQINTFLKAFAKGVVKDDAFDFLYLPDAGTKVYKNDQLMATVTGLEFKQALFGIWLSAQPISEKLKAQLLGQ